MMENSKEATSYIFSKNEKHTRNDIQPKKKKDYAMDQQPKFEKNDLISDKSIQKCCFCTKVFYNAKFLMLHILRRHSENLVVIYQKLNDLNNLDLKYKASQNDVIRIITNEFSKFRGDLESIKSSISTYHNEENVATKVDILTSEVQALKDTSAKIENDISDLKIQWNECDIKSYCTSLQLKDTLMYQSLKTALLLELQHLISENNEKQTLNISQISSNIKTDVERLEHLIKTNLEKIDASNLVQETIKSLENEIEYFFSCHKAKKLKHRGSQLNVAEKIRPKIKTDKSDFSHETDNFVNSEKPLSLGKNLVPEGTQNSFGTDYKYKKFRSRSRHSNFLEDIKEVESSPTNYFADFCDIGKLKDSHISADAQNSFCSEYATEKLKGNGSELRNHTEEINGTQKKIESDSTNKNIDVASEISQHLEKKLNDLNILPNTKSLSNTDYDAKMKLVESERKVLSKNYPSFLNVYHYLNSNLDQKVLQKLKTSSNKQKNLRFVLPTKLSRKKPKDSPQDCGTKYDSQESTSTESVTLIKDILKNITPINMSEMQLTNLNSNKLLNSAASIKLIANSNKKRKLPTMPDGVPKEFSPCDSLESDF